MVFFKEYMELDKIFQKLTQQKQWSGQSIYLQEVSVALLTSISVGTLSVDLETWKWAFSEDLFQFIMWVLTIPFMCILLDTSVDR